MKIYWQWPEQNKDSHKERLIHSKLDTLVSAHHDIIYENDQPVATV
jgi:hypothetical protein